MTSLENRLASLQEQMQRRWDKWEVANETGQIRQARLHMEKYRDLEAHETELRAELKSQRGTLEKKR